MDKMNQDIAYFISFCIEQYKVEKGIRGSEALALFSEYGILEYLAEHWEILSTQSRQWIVEDIDEYIRERDMDYPLLNAISATEIPIQLDGSLSISQQNVHLLLPSKISRMADMLAEDTGVSIIEAMKQLYSSKVYFRLEKEYTKAWHLGAVALYEDFQAGV